MSLIKKLGSVNSDFNDKISSVSWESEELKLATR